MKEELEIKKTQDNKIIEYKVKKIVKSSGTGAVIYMPKELIGKEVKIEYERKTK